MKLLQLNLADETNKHGIVSNHINIDLIDVVELVHIGAWETIMETEKFEEMKKAHGLKDDEKYMIRITTTGRGNYVEYYSDIETAENRLAFILKFAEL